jgi:hypothetical protein
MKRFTCKKCKLRLTLEESRWPVTCCGVRHSLAEAESVPIYLLFGEIVKRGLSAIGITKRRATLAVGKPCGCRSRQEALNDAGEAIFKALK